MQRIYGTRVLKDKENRPYLMGDTGAIRRAEKKDRKSKKDRRKVKAELKREAKGGEE